MQQTSTSVTSSLAAESDIDFPTSGFPTSTGVLLPGPAQSTKSGHIPIGPIVGTIIPACIILVGIFVYRVRRKRMMKPAPWARLEAPPISPSSNRLQFKQHPHMEKPLPQAPIHSDTIDGIDAAVDRPEVLCLAPAFPTDRQHVVPDNDLESRLRSFIRDRYGPSLPSGSPSLAASDEPPPY